MAQGAATSAKGGPSRAQQPNLRRLLSVGWHLLVWGLLAALAISAGSFLAYGPYEERHLAQPEVPFHDDQDTLAAFKVCGADDSYGTGRCFFFGLATAPAHVEDQLEDGWLEFAQATPPRGEKPGLEEGRQAGQEKPFNVPGWHNVAYPADRLRFWSEPDVEVRLAKEAGSSVFRMGVDWGRLVPDEPVNGTESALDRAVVERYRAILELVRKEGMQVFLTLFHHSLPKWAIAYGGWPDKRTVHYFVEFTQVVQKEFGDLIEFWAPFNEPHIFAGLTHITQNWPPGKRSTSRWDVVSSLLPFVGSFHRALLNLAEAHRLAYDTLHANHTGGAAIKVGIAHHCGSVRPKGLFDVLPAYIANHFNRYYFLDLIHDKLDWIGVNYYSQEVLHKGGPYMWDEVEFSDSGRGMYPDGLYHTLLDLHKRYNGKGQNQQPRLRFMISENGVADEEDLLRPAYIVEHVLAVYAARTQGVPVDGYLHWTISDNWEWADGYCPKFGLVAVDRANNLTRLLRPSYHLYAEISKTGRITKEQRAKAWQLLQDAIQQKKSHPFCRQVGPTGHMYADGLHEPVQRSFLARDWRFGKYEQHGLRDIVSDIARTRLGPLGLQIGDLWSRLRQSWSSSNSDFDMETNDEL